MNDQWVTEGIREKIKKFLESKKKMKMQPTTIWDTTKAVLKGKFIAINAYIKKETDTYFSNNLKMYLKILEKQEQTKHKTADGEK
jgi:hypothetical protein